MDLINSPNRPKPAEMSRRHFIKMSALAALAVVSPMPCFAAPPEPGDEERILFLYNTHTEETLKAVYWIDGEYVPSALKDIDYILRDHRTGETIRMDRLLLDLLHTLAVNLDATHPFHVISGYRSPKTNAMLRKNGRGVAKRSYHMLGKAIDIRLPNCSLSLLRDAAMELKGGGVGFYPQSNFIHVDVGPVRCW
jgi:uncharacterized protein YcbK (DUF882 family)